MIRALRGPFRRFVRRARHALLLAGVGGAIPAGLAAERPKLQGAPWVRHVIDADGRGADGTKLADVNGDGWPDIVTGWEEDGSTRLYLNPGPAASKGAWPKVVVGRTPSAEDALPVDLDGDGRWDVVTSTEGESRTVFVHWGPERSRLLDPAVWRQEKVPALAGLTRWMFAEPLQFDGRHGVDLVIGGRRGGTDRRSVLGWLEAPARPRDLAAWRWHPLLEAGWVMSIEITDMNGDGALDVLFSDRLEASRGVYWLENPGPARAADGAAWKRHTVGATSLHQVLFLGTGDLDGDGWVDIAAPVEDGRVTGDDPDAHSRVVWFRREDRSGTRWSERSLPVPGNTGNVKAVAIGDLDGDGRSDLVVSCENAAGARVGVYWLRGDGRMLGAAAGAFDISGAPGIKFDLVRLLDLDGDGDLDVLTNEEQEARTGLGVMWYENPAIRR